MARPKKDGRRANGIQGRRGFLYIVISHSVIRDGVKCNVKKWISTGLPDIPENIKKAEDERRKLLNRGAIERIDLNVTISDYIDQFLEKKKRMVSDTTYAAYYHRGQHIKKYFGNMRLKDLTEALVEKFLDDLFINGNVQPRTVKDIKILFGNAVDLAFKDGIIAYNPVKEVAINKKIANEYAREKNTDEEFFSYEEAQIFLRNIKDHELFELYYLTIFFGLRREEILGLRWSAINFKEKTMTINHTVTKGTGVNRINTTKTASSRRTYPLTDEQLEMFLNLKKKEKKYRKICGNCYFENDYVFKHEDGTLFYPDYPTKLFGKLIKSMPELPQYITLHGLRSSCVSILVHQGMDVKSIQKWVGHSDIDTTLRIYAKVKDKEAKQEISDTMNTLFSLEHNNKQ